MNTAKNKDGQIIHIESVESGKQIDLTCECCNAVVVAKKGAINIHHFAHLQGTECEYSRLGGEGILHMAAKRLIQERGAIWLPKTQANLLKSVVVGENTYRKYELSTEWKLFTFDAVQLEVRKVGYIPDLIATINGKKIAIEILVSHKCDAAKIALLERDNMPCIEIDLSKQTLDSLENYLFRGDTDFYNVGYSFKWLYNKKESELIEGVNQSNDDWIEYWKWFYDTKLLDINNYDIQYTQFDKSNNGQIVFHYKLKKQKALHPIHLQHRYQDDPISDTTINVIKQLFVKVLNLMLLHDLKFATIQKLFFDSKAGQYSCYIQTDDAIFLPENILVENVDIGVNESIIESVNVLLFYNQSLTS